MRAGKRTSTPANKSKDNASPICWTICKTICLKLKMSERFLGNSKGFALSSQLAG